MTPDNLNVIIYFTTHEERNYTCKFPIAAGKLIITENYYEAILALKLLLMYDTKSKEQEEALWLAHTLLVKWEKEIIENNLREQNTDQKIEILNKLGENFDNIEINWDYRYGFLHRLKESYPNTLKQPIVEYALIKSGYPVLQDEDIHLSLGYFFSFSQPPLNEDPNQYQSEFGLYPNIFFSSFSVYF